MDQPAISPAQDIQVQRLRLGSFNDMDGDKIADSLIKHRDLWDAFMFGRFTNHGALGTLIELRDLPDGDINASTLMLTTDKERWPKLLRVIKRAWGANEIGYTGADDSTWGTAPFATALDVSGAMGGGFHIKDEDGGIFPPGYKMMKGRLKKAEPKPSQVPIVVRVWWD